MGPASAVTAPKPRSSGVIAQRCYLQGMRTLSVVLLSAALLAAGAPPAHSASAKPCNPVVNPYEGTRYEGVDLTQIRATGVSCATARRTATGAHRRALGLTPSSSGIRRFTWSGWRVTGDLRGDSDRYTARKGDRLVRWRF
jgi:hypothetical protein